MNRLEQLLDLDDAVVLGERDRDVEIVLRPAGRRVRGLKALELFLVREERYEDSRPCASPSFVILTQIVSSAAVAKSGREKNTHPGTLSRILM